MQNREWGRATYDKPGGKPGSVPIRQRMAQSEQADWKRPLFPEAIFDLVAIAASAGGLNAIKQIVSELPANFPAAIVFLQHLDPDGPLLLADILSRHTPLPVRFARNGEIIQAGHIYVARPNWHLMIQPNGAINLTQAERVNFTRPAADLLFESVANSFRQRAIAVVLTGKGCDGAEGIRHIKRMGGLTIAQDHTTSGSFDMPHAAIETLAVDLILPLSQIALTLVKWVQIGETPL